MGSQPFNGANRSGNRPQMVAGHLISQLERLLRSEIELQLKYAAALEDEGAVIRKFRKDQIDERVESRGEIADRIEASAKQRDNLRQVIDPTNTMTITQIVRERTSKADKVKLLKLISTLKELVETNKGRGNELGRLVQFTQTIVDGSIAILRSATQPVTRSYGRNRVTIERDAPKTRAGMKITEA